MTSLERNSKKSGMTQKKVAEKGGMLTKTISALVAYGKNLQYAWNSIARRHWVETGKKVGLSKQIVEEILQETISQIPSVIEATYKSIPSSIPISMVDAICRGMENTAKKLVD